MDSKPATLIEDHHNDHELALVAARDQAVAELGRKAILGTELPALFDEAINILNGFLDADFVGLLELLPGEQEFDLRVGLGFPDGMVGGERISAQPGTVAGRMLRSVSPFVVDDFGPAEFKESRILEALRVHSVVGAVIEGRERPFGILSVLTTATRHFSSADAVFVQLVANVISGAVAQHDDEEDLEDVETRLDESQKMESIGRLAGGVAHDFNNLLTVILGCSELALAEPAFAKPGADTLRTYLNDIYGAGKRAEVLVDQLLAFGRRQVLQPVVLDPREVIESMNDMLRRLIRSDLQLRVRSEGAGRVCVDRGQLEQVIVNLVVNARDATPGVGTITIETSDVDINPASRKIDVVLPPGPYAVITVTDTGTGMDAATMSACFDPFFTTKELGVGSGLGLSTVFGIVNQSGGHISVHSELRRGSEFKVYLPWTLDQTLPTVNGESPTEKVSGGYETVLVVEDDVAVRSLTRRVLERYGYTVLGAASGAEALTIMGSHEGRVHLLLTDLVMPEMSGITLVKWVHARSPGVKILVASGYPRDGFGEEGKLSDDVGFLEKPFGPLELARAVRQALDGGSAPGALPS